MLKYFALLFVCLLVIACWKEQDPIGWDTDLDDTGPPVIYQDTAEPDETDTDSEPPDTDPPG